MDETTEVDFTQEPGKTDRWLVYAKNSVFHLGWIEWSERKKAYDFKANANGMLMRAALKEAVRRELQQFCAERTADRGNEV